MKKNVYDKLAWIAFFILLIYILLKITGLLNSPLIVDIIAVLSAGYFVGRYAMKIDTIFIGVEHLKSDVRRLNDAVFRRR